MIASLQAAAAAVVFGTFCVAPSALPSKLMSPGLECQRERVSLRLDKEAAIPWPLRDSVPLERLAVDQRHLVTVLCNNKPIQSFYFRFSQFDAPDLCLTFDNYEGVGLGQKRRGTPCACQAR